MVSVRLDGKQYRPGETPLFLPIGDSPNPQRFTPYVTWGIIAVNVAVFVFINLPLSTQAPGPSHTLLVEYLRMLIDQGIPPAHIRAIISQTSLNDLVLFHYGYKPADPSVVSLFSSLFMHSGFMHLFGNMLFLYIYGDNVEHQMGRIKYFLMYLATGVIATLSFALLAGPSLTPLVGASGAISGVLGCYFLMFPRNKVKVFILLFPIFMNVIAIPARIVLAIYVLIDNLLPVLVQAGGNVAHGAHLGGFFGGLAIAALGEHFGWRSPLGQVGLAAYFNGFTRKTAGSSSSERAGSRDRDGGLPHDVQNILAALKDGDTATEFSTLDPAQMLAAAKSLKNHGLLEPANKALKIALVWHKRSPLLPEVYYELGETRMQQGFATAAYQHFLTALDLGPDAELEKKIRMMLERIDL